MAMSITSPFVYSVALLPLEWSSGDTTKEGATTTGERGRAREGMIDGEVSVNNENADKLVDCGGLIN